MESPNCAVALQSASSHPLPPTARTGQEYNENSLNAALLFQLHTSAQSRYITPENESNSVLRDGYASIPTLRPTSRPFSLSLPNPNRSRPLSEILDEAINISNEFLFNDSNDDQRVVPSLFQRQTQPQDVVNQAQQRRTRKVQHHRRDQPQQ
jgi:hypothetical protein